MYALLQVNHSEAERFRSGVDDLAARLAAKRVEGRGLVAMAEHVMASGDLRAARELQAHVELLSAAAKEPPGASKIPKPNPDAAVVSARFH